MGIELILFYVFATILIGASLSVISIRNPVFAALFLVLAFFSCSAIWILLEAEFLALTLVLVYVGAVMVLFLFVVMMLDINIESLKKEFTKYIPVGLLIGLVLIVQLSMVLGPEHFGLDKVAVPIAHAADYNNTRELGLVLYTDYLYPFEIAAVILLVAIIAAIVLTMRKRKQKQFMTPEQQVIVKSSDRVRLANIPAQKKK